MERASGRTLGSTMSEKDVFRMYLFLLSGRVSTEGCVSPNMGWFRMKHTQKPDQGMYYQSVNAEHTHKNVRCIHREPVYVNIGTRRNLCTHEGLLWVRRRMRERKLAFP